MNWFSLALIPLLLISLPAFAVDLYVSPAGNDAWSGKLADPDAAGKDGPMATIGAALEIAKEQRKSKPVSIVLRGGELLKRYYSGYRTRKGKGKNRQMVSIPLNWILLRGVLCPCSGYAAPRT